MRNILTGMLCRLPLQSGTTERDWYLSLLSPSLLTLLGSGVTPAQLWLGPSIIAAFC